MRPGVLIVLAVLALGAMPSQLALARGARGNMPKGHVWPPSRPMVEEGDACLKRLEDVGLHFRKARRKRQVATPIVVPDMTFAGVKLVPKWRKGPFVMDCHLAEALLAVSEPWFALGVRELRFSSIFDYRNVRVGGGTKERLSRHALGLAIDVYEVVDAQGLVHVVADHYFNLDLFLPAVEATANGARQFRKVLSPVRDPRSHHDHLHLEARVDYRVPKVRPSDRRKRAKRHARRRSKRRHRRAQ